MGVPACFVSFLVNTFGVEESDLPGLKFSAPAGATVLCAYYFIQPLSDTLALSMGVEYTPLVTVGNMFMIIFVNPLFAHVAKTRPIPEVLPTLYRVLMACLAGFALLFVLFPGVKQLSFSFSVYVGTFSLFLMTSFWGRMASLHSKHEVKRIYGVISAGAQVGQLIASIYAPALYGLMGNTIVLVSVVLLEGTVQLVKLRGQVGLSAEEQVVTSPTKPAGNQETGKTEADAPKGCCNDSSALKGLTMLMSTPFLRALSCHTLLITFITGAVWYERADAVAAAFASDANPEESEYTFFARLNTIVGVLTLALQLFAFSRVLKMLGFHGTLLAEPVAIMLGLVVAIVQPGLLSIAFLDGFRKVVHYAFVKPTKEGLYASVSKEVTFIAKPVLDTLVYRTGSLLGAGYFTIVLAIGVTPVQRRVFLFFVTVLWAVNSYVLGKLAEQQQKEVAQTKPKELL